jgi:hypothetical protein
METEFDKGAKACHAGKKFDSKQSPEWIAGWRKVWFDMPIPVWYNWLMIWNPKKGN